MIAHSTLVLVEVLSEMATIEYCSCRSSFQDRRYGKSLRVHNWSGKHTTPQMVRCTVCGVTKAKGATEREIIISKLRATDRKPLRKDSNEMLKKKFKK